jgi:hypothetical protein
MRPHWLERLKSWICTKLGHVVPIHGAWHFNGKIHRHCKRCGRIISVKAGDIPSPTRSWMSGWRKLK